MKQKEAGLRKKGSLLLRDITMQMEPIAIMVRLRRASTAADRFRSAGVAVQSVRTGSALATPTLRMRPHCASKN